MSKSSKDYSHDDYDGVNFRSDKKSKNRFVRRNTKNILKHLDDIESAEELDEEIFDSLQ